MEKNKTEINSRPNPLPNRLPAGKVDTQGKQSLTDTLKKVDRTTESIQQLQANNIPQARADGFAQRLAGKSVNVAHADSDPIHQHQPSPNEALRGMQRVEDKEAKLRDRD